MYCITRDKPLETSKLICIKIPFIGIMMQIDFGS